MRFDDGTGLRDIVGHVRRADPAEGLLVERRDGELVPIPSGTVRFLRVVPDRPLRRRPAARISPEDLMRVASRGWPAIESVRLGDWELRASGGFTGRANSVATHGDPGTDDPIGAVTRFYVERGLPPVAQVVVGSSAERLFTRAGWRPLDGPSSGAIVQVADLVDPPPADPDAVVADQASDLWLRHYGKVDDPDPDPDLARAVLEAPETVGFVSISDVAIGRVVVTGEWAGLAAIEVDPDHRRRGLGRRVVRTCLAWAAEHGADKAYLQVHDQNAASLALHAAFGFVDHHAYRHLTPARA